MPILGGPHHPYAHQTTPPTLHPMSQPGSDPQPTDSAVPATPVPAYSIREPLPAISSPIAPAAILARLSTASKRGRLAGFIAEPGGNAFRAALFSEPFDHELRAAIEPAPGGGSIIRASARMLPKMPLIFAVVLIITVYPGVLLTDTMIPGEWGWIDTWIWYVPLTALPIPWIWAKLMKKSRTGAGLSAYELLHKLATEVEGRVETGPSATT